MHTYIYLFDDLWTGNNKGTLTTGKRSDLFCAGFSPIFLRLLLRRRIVSTWKCIKELCNFVQSSVTVRERVQKQRRRKYQHLVLSTSPHSVFLFYKMVQSGGRGQALVHTLVHVHLKPRHHNCWLNSTTVKKEWAVFNLFLYPSAPRPAHLISLSSIFCNTAPVLPYLLYSTFLLLSLRRVCSSYRT